jgi:hypothetical protein
MPEKYLPSTAIEYLFYAQMFYSIMGTALGLSFGSVGIGLLVLLTGACVWRLGLNAVPVLMPVALAIACGVSYIGIQVLVHNLSYRGDYTREYMPWVFGLVLTQCLALRRGFLHRAALVVLAIGLTTLPFLQSFGNDESRTGLTQGIVIGNPNDLGAWFGFCCVYLTILGLETRRTTLRVLAWVAAAACLFVIGLTVSRGPLLAAALAIVFACRRLLKHGFVPFFCLLLVVWVAVGLGLFDAEVAKVTQRGAEDSGRIDVWPRAIARIVEVPMSGVGANDLPTPRRDGTPITPHNAFILLALAAGVVPFLLFVGYWIRCLIDVRRLTAAGHEDAPFLSALLLYSFLIVMNLNQPYMLPWMMISLAAMTGPAFLLKANVMGRRWGRGRSAAGPPLQPVPRRTPA